VAQIKVKRGTFICAQIKIYEYTNRLFSVDVEHYYSHTTFIFSLFPLPPHLLPPRPLSSPPPPPAAVSAAAVSVAAVSRFRPPPLPPIIAGECRLPVMMTTIPSLLTFCLS
jgi:hypothetical protein